MDTRAHRPIDGPGHGARVGTDEKTRAFEAQGARRICARTGRHTPAAHSDPPKHSGQRAARRASPQPVAYY